MPLSRRVAVPLGLALIGAGAALLFFNDPHVPGRYPPCLFHWLTGLWCPGCGMTRALHDILHLRVVEGFWENPLLVLAFPFVFVAGIRAAWRLFVDTSIEPWVISQRWLKIGFAVLFVYWIARNLPWYPFTLLAAG